MNRRSPSKKRSRRKEEITAKVTRVLLRWGVRGRRTSRNNSTTRNRVALVWGARRKRTPRNGNGSAVLGREAVANVQEEQALLCNSSETVETATAIDPIHELERVERASAAVADAQELVCSCLWASVSEQVEMAPAVDARVEEPLCSQLWNSVLAPEVDAVAFARRRDLVHAVPNSKVLHTRKSLFPDADDQMQHLPGASMLIDNNLALDLLESVEVRGTFKTMTRLIREQSKERKWNVAFGLPVPANARWLKSRPFLYQVAKRKVRMHRAKVVREWFEESTRKTKRTELRDVKKATAEELGLQQQLVLYQRPQQSSPTDQQYKMLIRLDDISLKMYNQLVNGGDVDDETAWRFEQERKLMKLRFKGFIQRMDMVQGSKEFSKWGGSLVDSIVGAFLTQNVSDHLSSSAFMSLASAFPANKEARPRKHGPVHGSAIELSKKEFLLSQKSDDPLKWKLVQEKTAGVPCLPPNDTVDWEAVRLAPFEVVASCINERGQSNVLAGRIKGFLERIYNEHGSTNLEWLRNLPQLEAKEFLLSIRGLGIKSVECIRLLAMEHIAFPVDTNVGRISVRLGWVPLEPLPAGLHFHLLRQYPIQDTVQQYLWPRLCTLDHRTLYAGHYHFITFGKTLCTKYNPNCQACPMKDKCLYFASVVNLQPQLPATSTKNTTNAFSTEYDILQLERDIHTVISHPIIEEPMEENETMRNQEDKVPDIEDTIEVTGDGMLLLNLCNRVDNDHIISSYDQALTIIPSNISYMPVPKLKQEERLRTVHLVYELPDNHPLIDTLKLEPRHQDDPSFYSFAIWTKQGCVGSVHDIKSVKGSLLIPCRTAMQGKFPLNGTYFQTNEVFADHSTSSTPIEVSREYLWNLRRRFVYFGSSVSSIIKGLSLADIRSCFLRGYICVRAFDRELKAPRQLERQLHLLQSERNMKTNRYTD